MRAEVVDDVSKQQHERFPAETLAPQRRLADADPYLRALALRLPVAVVRLADGPSFVLDREELSVPLPETVHPLPRRGRIFPASGASSPLEPREVLVIA